MPEKQADKGKRGAKWYDEIPNSAIRTRIQDELKLSAQEAAKLLNENGVNVTPEAVRQWCGGYSRPDIAKLRDIAKALDCSCNYLLGVSDTPIPNNEGIRERIGLSDDAIAELERRYRWKKELSKSGEVAAADMDDVDFIRALNYLLTDGHYLFHKISKFLSNTPNTQKDIYCCYYEASVKENCEKGFKPEERYEIFDAETWSNMFLADIQAALIRARSQIDRNKIINPKLGGADNGNG